jgi:DNA-binding IclR family transcriptional regulator
VLLLLNYDRFVPGCQAGFGIDIAYSQNEENRKMAGTETAAAGIKSVEKAVQILAALSSANGPLRLIDVAAKTGMSRSMTHGYLVSLVRTGMVVQDPSSGLYDLGKMALELGLVALTRADFLQLARDTMNELARELGQTIMLAVWSDNGPVIVGKIEGARHSVYEVRIGSTPNLLLNATCHVFMAYLPREKWARLVPEARKKDPRAAGISDNDIKRFIEEVRSAGVSTHPTSLANSAAIAAPVFDLDGELKGVLTVVGQLGDLDTDASGTHVSRLTEAAQSLSQRLGGGRGPGRQPRIP